jgi:hypothetical protein
MRTVHRSLLTSAALSLLLLGLMVSAAETRVRPDHLARINKLLRQYDLPQATVRLDSWGRVALSGRFRDREEVQQAHSLVQSVVGATWTSFVTPENVELTDLEKTTRNVLGDLFSKVKPREVKPQELEPRERETPAAIPRIHALVVGINEFRDGKIPPLKYAATDAVKIDGFLRQLRNYSVSPENVVLLADENATVARIMQELNAILERADVDDVVVLYFATHGTRPDADGFVGVVAFDTVFDPPAQKKLRRTSITGDALADFSSRLKARRLVAILDTCYSAGTYRAIPGFMPQDARTLGIEEETFGYDRKGVERIIGSRDLVREDDISLGAGAPDSNAQWAKVFISASAAGEQSYESEKLQGGYFTHHLLRGLASTGNIRDSFIYTKHAVPPEVWLDKRKSQNPRAFFTNQAWAIPF